MELCEKAALQMEEYEIRVAEATDMYTYVRFSLLASTWLPRPVGVCLWSLLHTIALLYFPLMLVVVFLFHLVLAVFVDALMLVTAVNMVLIYPLCVMAFFLGIGIGFVICWIYLLITCTCWPSEPMPNFLHSGSAEPVAQQGAPARSKFPGPLDGFQFPNLTVKFFKYVAAVSVPCWRVRLGSLCREIVPLYDAIVI